MIDYRTPLPDLLFALRHGAGAARLPHWDDETAETVLTHAAAMVDEVIAPLDPVGDIEGTKLVDGRVVMPQPFVDAYRQFAGDGWQGLAVPEEDGGQGLPHILASALSEMLSGACITYQMVLSLAHGAMRTLAASGSEAQRAAWIPRLAAGEVLATMCLTEAQAGSDLGLVRTMASPQADGSWSISGGKIFISGGDQNLTGGQIMHLVLARTPDAPAGVKGLSLFLCPSHLEDGSRNAISVVRLEEKMGMHASPTCQVAFDGARAEIIGAPGEGLARMFTMMNAERLDVAVQGVGLAEVALQRSLAYANERKQGRAGKDGGPDFIAKHGDVRRMLLAQMALAMGCRAMVMRTLVDLELGDRPALMELMTPVAKAFATEAAMEAADHAIQVHGGYGFLREYRVEQILRDGRITRIYEGTNGIQAATVAGRVIRLDNGRALTEFKAEVEESMGLASPAFAGALGRALAAWDEASAAMLGRRDIGLTATSYLRLTGLLAFGAAWARLEAKAEHAANPARIRAVAEYVRDWMLPETRHLADLCRNSAELGSLPDGVFAS
ncbi:acyl-CoA dehydrogenase family protein [Paramagnetospirillum magneticum]|uniref:Acyl-CoA dehydrogenase n=1 Tax=Paramagnetospirillum magneticum (strain ATCC 700264 / AMB-1) TaxID=342108 RepID=Q2W5P7_PARM1|nr:acyl-CoA dehydrogenase family protein [Paramagnetospirillum magneticum]BAE50828.1 Acyl-CoA dehydrogenase [Paramagnetospirillum magneticum AMB-1]